NDPYNQTPMPSSPYGQPRTPVSVASPFSPTHSMIPQSQQCVQSNDSYSMQTANQRPQQSFSTDYHSNQMDSSQNNELYTNIGQRIGQRTPDSYNPNMSSPNTDPYARPVPTPQPSHSPQSEPFQKMSPNVIQPDIYSRQPMTPRPQQPIQRSQFDDIYAQQKNRIRPLKSTNQASNPIQQPMNVRLPFAPPPAPYPGQQELSLPPPPPYPQAMPTRQVSVKQTLAQQECVGPQTQIRSQRPAALLQEQPLLLEDLVEQEKRDQRQTMPIHSRTFIPTQMPTENIMPQSDSLLSDVEFERLKADILSDDPISGPVIHSCPPTQSPIQQFPHQMPSNSSASPHWQNISEPCYPQQQRMPLNVST
ncbi:unnamed protein product, partial [Sphagnum balticum]